MVVMKAISQSLEKLYKWVLTELSNADSNDVYTVRIQAYAFPTQQEGTNQ